MRAVIQRVIEASVTIDNNIHSQINGGLLVLLGIKEDDAEKDILYIIDKIINLRIFRDSSGKLNESITSLNGQILIVSQFTLYGDARKGRRPSYSDAAGGEIAEKIYDTFVGKIKTFYESDKIKTGKFGASMQVKLTNDGPVTILLDSERVF